MVALKSAESEGRAGSIEAVTVPGWSELPWLVHGFSTRFGGRTTAYLRDSQLDKLGRDGELNLGFTDQDSRVTVACNRELWLSHLLGADEPKSAEPGWAAKLTTVRQIHSSTVHRVSHAQAEPAMLTGDGLMTDAPGLLLGILTADCVPVLTVDRRLRATAAFHAGWRGTLQQIVEHGIARMREEFGSVPEDLAAAVGPAIGACCYTVGEEVREQFAARFRYADELLSAASAHAPDADRGDRRVPVTHLNLAEANRRQLLAAGLSERAISMLSFCTSCNTKRFFSHRAEGGVAGRMMAVIGTRA